jgi:hypothetical protein
MRWARPKKVGTAMLFAASLAVASCGGGTPAISEGSTLGGSPGPATSDLSADPEACRLIPLVHAGLDDLTAAVAAARAGNNSLTMVAASRAVTQGDVMSTQLRAMSGGPTGNKTLRVLVASGYLFLGQLGGLLADPEVPLEDKVRNGEKGLAQGEQVVGSAEALAAGGACPGFVLSASPLPTLAPLPRPSDGPAPPGTVADQAAAALATLNLHPAAGIEFHTESRIRWLPKGGIGLRNLQLTNRTDAVVQFPLDLTVLRWDGSAWTKDACPEALTTGPRAGLCGVVNTNAELLPPGTISSEDQPPSALFFIWPGMTEVAPGTYALLLPIWRTAVEYPDTEPIEATVAIVTITSAP